MAWCKYCGKKIEFARNEAGKFLPYDDNGEFHYCIPIPDYIAKRKRVLDKSIKEKTENDKLQISESEFI